MPTYFEAFEHFVDLAVKLENLLYISRNSAIDRICSCPAPPPSEWWYYGVLHGQHIGFFLEKTFEYLAEKHNLHFYTNGQNIHLMTDKQFLTPAFKWLTKASKFMNPLIQKRIESLTWYDFEPMKAEIT